MTTSTRRRRALRVVAAGALALAASTLGATTSQAHVRVHPDSTATGSFSALTFRVPNESATAGTVKVAVQLPQDQPFLYVSTKPVAGWSAHATEEALPQPVTSEGTTLTKAVRTVTWTAEKGTRIGPGEYQEFSLSVGPLPAPGTVLLPATQTYSDGTVVRWDEPTPASGEEPEHPAPELVVTAAAPSAAATPAAPRADGEGGSDTVALWLSGAALLVAAAALVAALPRRRRTGS